MILKLSAKCSDMFSAQLYDKHNEFFGEYSGYVPDFFPGQHYGDYIMLDIDTDTGQIVNWKKPKAAQLQDLLKKY